MNLDDKEKFFIAIVALLGSVAWFMYSWFQQPFQFPFEPLLLFVPAVITTIYLFKKITREQTKQPKELNNIPDRLTDGFVGRIQDITNINDRLLAHQHVSIRGIGGLGKTSLAQAYICQYHKYFDHIVYVSIVLPPDQDNITDTDFRECILQGFTFDKVLLANLDIKPNADTSNIDIFKVICGKLAQVEGTKNLLVIDNAGSVLADTIFMDELPKRPQWHILCTSRHEIVNFDIYTLETLPRPEAQLLFEKGYKARIDDYAALENIFEAVSYLTVAIDLLAKTAKSADLSVADLWKRVENYSLDFKDAAKVRAGQHNEAKTPAEHIIERFVLQELNDLEKSRLLPLAVLPSVPIQYEQLLAWLQTADDDKPDFKNTLNRLSEKGWVQKTNDKAMITISCHPIIQFAVRKQLKPNIENCAVLIDSFCKLLAVDSTKGEHGVFKKELLSYGEAVFKAVYNVNTNWTEDDKNLAKLADKLGWVYGDLDYLAKSVSFHEVCISIAENILPSNDTLLAEFYNNLALAYGTLNKNQKRLEYNLKAYFIWVDILDKHHPLLATSLNNIATTYSALGDYQKGLEYDLKAWNIRDAILDKKHPDLATSYNNIGVSYKDLGNYQKSLEYHLQALNIREEVLDKLHPNLAKTYSNIAETHYFLKNFDMAKNYINKAVKIQEIIYHITHPLLLNSLQRQSKINQALQYLEKDKSE